VDKFQDYYRIPSARAGWLDYSSPGKYFITICTAYHECIFGRIENDEMKLSEQGIIAWEEWSKSFEIRSELICDAFVIMPNHLHAVLWIVEMDGNRKNDIELRLTGSQKIKMGYEKSQINYGVAYRPPKSISSFVGGFKSAATSRINELKQFHGISVWQARFHDHIIRDEAEYFRIVRYIKSNPQNWKEDKYYK
jgi:REP element-mobilizing transposase RayT